MTNLPKYKNILLVGSTGNVGAVLVDELKKLNVGNIIAPEQKDLDYFEKYKIHDYLEDYRPEVIFLVGAYTNVDKAEGEDKSLCYKINVKGIESFLSALISYHDDFDQEYRPTIIYISTEMVGPADHPLTENEQIEVEGEIREHVTEPLVALNEYGKTKALAEKAVKKIYENSSDVFDYRILRICFPIAGWRKGSVLTLLKNTVGEGKEVSLVSDEVQTWTYIPFTAHNSILIAKYGKNGVYHDAMLPKSDGRGYSPFEIGMKFSELMGYDTSLIGKMKHQDMYDKDWWTAPRGLSAELVMEKGLMIEGWKSGTMEEVLEDFVKKRK